MNIFYLFSKKMETLFIWTDRFVIAHWSFNLFNKSHIYFTYELYHFDLLIIIIIIIIIIIYLFIYSFIYLFLRYSLFDKPFFSSFYYLNGIFTFIVSF